MLSAEKMREKSQTMLDIEREKTLHEIFNRMSNAVYAGKTQMVATLDNVLCGWEDVNYYTANLGMFGYQVLKTETQGEQLILHISWEG
ncbi:hypothetical protein NSQ26_09680 [Bacillus sp. FSL W7-1360]